MAADQAAIAAAQAEAQVLYNQYVNAGYSTKYVSTPRVTTENYAAIADLKAQAVSNYNLYVKTYGSSGVSAPSPPNTTNLAAMQK